MQAGRIVPLLRHFFRGTGEASQAGDSQSQKKQDQRQPDREPTKEEVLEALHLLSQQEEFRKNSLRTELKETDGCFFVLVSDASGAPLGAIRGAEILRVLEQSFLGSQGTRVGRILDRRV